MEGTGSAETPGSTGGEHYGKRIKDVLKRVLNKLAHIRLCFDIVFLVLVLEVLWELTSYVLNKSDEIIELSRDVISSNIRSYFINFDPYTTILHSMLIIAGILAFYSILGALNYFFGKKKNKPKTGRLLTIIGFLILDLLLYSLLRFVFNEENIREDYKWLAVLILVCAVVLQSEKLRNPKKSLKDIRNYVGDHLWSTGIFFYSLFFYFIVCFFFTEMKETKTGNYAGVFTLPGIAILIPVGFFICAFVIERIAHKNAEILESLKVKIKGTWKKIIKDLQKNIGSLLAHFLVVISSYIFLKAIFNVILPEESTIVPEESSKILLTLVDINDNLFIILLVPLYIFFYRAGSGTLESIYQRIYGYLEKPAGLVPLKSRKEYVVRIFVKITKLVIFILIIVSFLSRFEIFKLDFLSKEPYNYMIGTGIAVPITLWLIVLLLDPFFEGETIEVGSNKGKIKRVDVFFTKMETMTGEKIYLPNMELLAKTIRRLNAREPQKKAGGKKEEEKSQGKKEEEKSQGKKEEEKSQGKKEEEKGIMIYFSCTLSYVYDPCEIERTFKSLFGETETDKSKNKKKNESKEEKKKVFEKYLQEIDYIISEEELEYIFSEESHPFVFIEEFKDYGVVYRFNFRVRDSLYAPIFRGYFMKKFKEKMDKEGMPIVTPVKFEIKDIGRKEFRW